MRPRRSHAEVGKRWAILLTSAFLAAPLGCGVAGDQRGLDRPSSVPASATWVGGADGGVFVHVEERDGSLAHVYHAEVYGESGDLWYRGRLAAKTGDSTAIDVTDPEFFSAWDGEGLLLEDGSYLKAIDPMPFDGGADE